MDAKHDLKVQYPQEWVIGLAKRRTFTRLLQVVTAPALNCNGYTHDNGVTKWLALIPEEIDITLLPYADEYVRSSAPVLISIMGDAFPDRMDDIGLRLRMIQGDVSAWLRDNVDLEEGYPPGSKLVSVSYTPLPVGTWV